MSPDRSLQPYDVQGYSVRREPAQFLRFLRENVSIEFLLESRTSQARLHSIMDKYFTREKEIVKAISAMGEIMVLNSYPVLEFSDPVARSGSWMHNGFLLKDRKYYYYFQHFWPQDSVPPYLRPEDIVPSGSACQSFPPEIRTQIRDDLGINNEQLNYLIYMQDPRVTRKAVYVDIPFNKPISRVSVRGGVAQRYNYNSKEWEDNGDGIYTPSLGQRLKFAIF